VASRDALPVSAAALRERGRELDRAGKWDDARAIYHKLERFKSYAHEALYRQAWDAYQANDPMAAMQLARRVAFHAGPYVLPARFLYGDSLVRLGDCAGAKRFYLALRRKLRGEDRATATRKITLCNQMLKLAVADGMETSDDR
jgi:TolA-binding protein